MDGAMASNLLNICLSKDERFPDLPLKGMFSGLSWWVEAATAVFDLSTRASCPFHCSGSCLPWFVAGFSLGIILALFLLLTAFIYLVPLLHRGRHTPFDFTRLEVVQKRPVEVDRQARLAAYVD